MRLHWCSAASARWIGPGVQDTLDSGHWVPQTNCRNCRLLLQPNACCVAKASHSQKQVRSHVSVVCGQGAAVLSLVCALHYCRHTEGAGPSELHWPRTAAASMLNDQSLRFDTSRRSSWTHHYTGRRWQRCQARARLQLVLLAPHLHRALPPPPLHRALPPPPVPPPAALRR